MVPTLQGGAMKRVVVGLLSGCALVAAVAVAVLLTHRGWQLFAVLSAVLTAVLLVLCRGALTGSPKHREPVSERRVGEGQPPIFDGERLAAQAFVEMTQGDVDEASASLGFTFLFAAVPTTAALVLCLVLR
jgi:hypothetical protein